MPDAWDVGLSARFGAKSDRPKCQYTYDFGDSWVHEVTFRKSLHLDDRFERRLLAGKRACPLEDSGGVWGYARMAEVVETGRSDGEEDDELALWTEGWHPDTFDLATAKARFDR